MPEPLQDLHFEIDSWVVFQLGEQLITDVVQAIVELVKNSYDADATYAKVTINTTEAPGEPFRYKSAPGYVLIEDNGTGMTDDRIRHGWLHISSSHKRAFKEQRRQTPLGRTPLGDKGLGRLCTQRLGTNVEIITRAEGITTGRHVAFSWADFLLGRGLTEVSIYSEGLQRDEVGTALLVSDLKDAGQWASERTLGRLQTGLSRLISPFQSVRDFYVTVTVNGVPLDLADIAENIRNAATIRYALSSDGKEFKVQGRFRLDFMRPSASQKLEKEQFRQLVDTDKGEALAKFLLKNKRAKDLGFRKAKLPWYLEFETSKALELMPELARDNSLLANPGPFKGEIDSFDLGDDLSRPTDVFNQAADFKNYISQMHGIRVYRDGFGIRVDEDWLGLGKQWTSSGSYYGLKPANTLGFIAITARDNPTLQETTNREGFTDTPHYRTFYALLQDFVSLSAQAQNFLKRGWLKFKAEILETQEGGTNRSNGTNSTNSTNGTPVSSEELAEQMRAQLDAAATGTDRLKTVGATLETALNHCAEVVRAAADDLNASPEVKAALKEVESVVSVFEDVRSQVEKGAGEIDRIRHLGEQVTVRLEGLREQLADMYDMVGLGLTAEALSHEIAEIANGLAERTQTIRQRMSKDTSVPKPLTTYFTHVTSSVAALRKQLQHLAPSLKYVRHQREPIPLADFLREMEEYHRPRLVSNGIRIESKGTGFTVTMNRGRLTQVFDNLCLNSEYWLKQELVAKRINGGIITVTLEEPFLRIADNGRGVDRTVEASLFEPFVTAKPRGEGRGLGLFITSQLLEGEGCRIGLAPTRNIHKRLYIFEIDMSGAVNANQ